MLQKEHSLVCYLGVRSFLWWCGISRDPIEFLGATYENSLRWWLVWLSPLWNGPICRVKTTFEEVLDWKVMTKILVPLIMRRGKIFWLEIRWIYFIRWREIWCCFFLVLVGFCRIQHLQETQRRFIVKKPQSTDSLPSESPSCDVQYGWVKFGLELRTDNPDKKDHIMSNIFNILTERNILRKFWTRIQ